MLPVHNYSYENHFYSKPIHARDYKENGYNTQYRYKKTSIVQELSTIQFNEKELNEKIRNWFEGTSERVGLVLGKVLEIMIERDYSAFQLFKSIMTSKSKTKLKLINYEDEKNFYPQFWNTIAFQKDAVKIEGLKLLGFLTSEYIHNISQQTQIDCIKNLKSLSSLHNNSFNVIRLSLNCIGNILTHSKYKIVDENQEIFYNLYEILKNFTTYQKLEDHNNIRTLAALLRVLNCLHLDFKTFPQTVCELLVTQLNKYLYLGTNFYSFSGSSSYIHHDSSLETIISTSSSEISETEENEDKKKREEVYSKIRNYCAACLSNVLRQNNKLIPQYLATLLPSRPLSKELTTLLQSMNEPLLIAPLDYSEKSKKKQAYWEEVKEDFNEASLLNLLLFEENSKVRLSVCKTIAAILDGYYDKSLFIANEGNQANINQIYQIFKNLASAVILSLFIEDDEMIFNHLLRLTSTMVAHYSYEKISNFSLQILVKNFLSKITIEYQYHTIFLNCISCFSALANGNFKESGFEELAINPNFNIVKILFKTIRDSMDNLLNNKESKFWKQDGIAESTILLESIIALLKFPKHYVEYIIENSESLIYVLDKLQSFDKKFVNVIFKLVEETMKYITNNKADAEGDNEGFEIKDDTPKSNSNNSRPQLHQNLENKIRYFHTSLEKLFRQIVYNPNNENIEFVLNILYYLEEDHWNLYYTETKKKLLAQIFRLNNIQALKQALLRLLGKICVFNTFIQTENFHSVIYNVLTLNYPEKNNNVMIKNSWVLANLCANLKNFQVFTVEQNQDILLMILGYCGSSKEKLVSNGFRALGYFISNNYDEMLCQILTYKNSKAKEVITALSEIYLKPFDSYSVKVCWNVCVSLSNIFKSYKPNFMKLFFKDPVLKNIAKILTTKNNFKTQIHCIEMLALAYEKYPENECFASLPKDLATIYFLADDQEFDQSELRYLPHLKESAKTLLLKLLDSNVFNKDLNNLIEILNANPHKFLQIFYENIRVLYNADQNKNNSIQEDNSQETAAVRQRRLQSVENFSIPIQQLNRNESKDLKEFLDKISKLSQKFVNLVDASEDISVSFAVYEGLEQLAGIDLTAEDQYINLELPSL